MSSHESPVRAHQEMEERTKRTVSKEGGVAVVIVGMGTGLMSHESFDGRGSSRPAFVPRHPSLLGPGSRLCSLAGLHAQLLPVRGLLGLRLGAGVRAAVERRHGAAFGVGVQAAVGRRVVGLELSRAFHLLQSTDCLYTYTHTGHGRR